MTYHPYSEVENSNSTGPLDGVTVVVTGDPEDMRGQHLVLDQLRARGASIIIDTGTRSRLGSLLALASLSLADVTATSRDVALMELPFRRLDNDPPPFAMSRDPGKQKAQWKRETYGKPRK